ncbi:MAG: hypothetical protein IKM20_02570 [Erysipelotrichales bacterium]|nr:hypothetical protein [Erysipelotrichales bacterium]
MIIRDYNQADEKAWIYCRVASFLDCSYYNDVKTKKDIYEHPSICLVAEDDNHIIGFIDVEIDSDDLTATMVKEVQLFGILAYFPNIEIKKSLSNYGYR